jgi:hypothetical protein
MVFYLSFGGTAEIRDKKITLAKIQLTTFLKKLDLTPLWQRLKAHRTWCGWI